MPYADPEDQKKAARRWYQKNKEKQIQRVKEHSYRVKHEVRHYKSTNPCADCGCVFPHYVMDFDHVRGEKVSNVACLTNRNVARKQVWDEIEKCDLVCANCHRFRTFRRLAEKRAEQ